MIHLSISLRNFWSRDWIAFLVHFRVVRIYTLDPDSKSELTKGTHSNNLKVDQNTIYDDLKVQPHFKSGAYLKSLKMDQNCDCITWYLKCKIISLLLNRFGCHRKNFQLKLKLATTKSKLKQCLTFQRRIYLFQQQAGGENQ